MDPVSLGGLVVNSTFEQHDRGDSSASRDAQELKHLPPHDPQTNRFSTHAEARPFLVTA